MPSRRIPSWMISSEPKANIKEATGIASRRIGGFSGIVPLIDRQYKVKRNSTRVHLHNELDNDDDPCKAKVPVKPVKL